MKVLRGCFFAVLLILLPILAACSPDDDEEAPRAVGPPGEETTAPANGNVSLPTTPEGTVEETTGIQEGTLGPSLTEAPEIVLRLEGDEGTRFSGLCEVGGEENVLSGQVPKRFTFENLGGELSCRIQKQDDGGGVLRVILLSGDTTRSVQQTNAPDGTIQVSYTN